MASNAPAAAPVAHAGSAATHGQHGAHGAALHGPAGHGAPHHITPASLYWKVFAALMVLLFITVVAAVIDFQAGMQKLVGFTIPGLNIGIALLIAGVKAALVVLFFMHVKGNTRLTYVWAAAGFVWLLLMFAMIFTDYVARGNIEVDAQGWESPVQATPVQMGGGASGQAGSGAPSAEHGR